LDGWEDLADSFDVTKFTGTSDLLGVAPGKIVVLWTFGLGKDFCRASDPGDAAVTLLENNDSSTHVLEPLAKRPRRAGYWGNVLLVNHGRLGQHRLDTEQVPRQEGTSVNGPPGLVRSHWLRQDNDVDVKKLEEAKAIGGMKRPCAAIEKIPLISSVGSSIYEACTSYLAAHPDAVEAVHSAVGENGSGGSLPENHVSHIRGLLADIVGATDTEPVHNGVYDTCVRAGLLGAWRKAAGDPDDQPEEWLRTGAPAGIRCVPADRGIFPRVDDVMDDPELLGTFDCNLTQSRHLDEQDIALEKFEEFRDKGYVKEFASYEDLVKFLDGEVPVISDVHVITKIRNGNAKHRIILNCKKAGLTRSSQRSERSILPRVTDAVADVMDLSLANTVGGFLLQIGVLDFADAFWLIPLHRRERRFFTTRIGRRFFAFLKTAQGSRGAPLTWSRFGALLARLIQSVIGAHRGRLELYVDDTFLAFYNTASGGRADFATVVYLWTALGLPLTLKKAGFGTSITWTSGVFTVTTAKLGSGDARVRLVVQVKPDTVREVAEFTAKYRSQNLIPIKELRSYVGKCTAIASLVFTWNPFLKPLWAALTPAAAEGSRAPKGCVWTRQIQDSLDWIHAFLTSEGALIRRVYNSEDYFGKGKCVEIDLDASPWGLGGILRVDNSFLAWFSEPISSDDVAQFGFAVGDHRGQQTWECLATLVALRLWLSPWREVRICLRVRSDSTTALQLLLTLKSTGSGPNMIGRELSLDLAFGSYRPNVAAHLPGVANAGPDVLSRLMMPDMHKAFPPYLRGVTRAYPPRRTKDWYRACKCPHLATVASHTAEDWDGCASSSVAGSPSTQTSLERGADVFQ